MISFYFASSEFAGGTFINSRNIFGLVHNESIVVKG